MDGETAISDRLEMLLVLRWMDEGRSPEGAVELSLRATAAELGLQGEDCLAVMRALDVLENECRVSLIWPGRPFDSDDVQVLLLPAVTRQRARLDLD